MNGKTCEVCLRNQAKYVCGKCGRNACEFCFNSHSWLCLKCEEQMQPIAKVASFDTSKLIFLGFILIFIGMFIMFIAFLLTGVSNGGIMLFFGPIPFMLNFRDGNIKHLILVFIAFTTVILLFLTILFSKRKY
ncbi:hypothetical protein KEJ50_02465 [Candidatus Bathyarchaeota archaeon]|nr:hypothetical protein [Candidatus Bathyarchaeota archaeon]